MSVKLLLVFSAVCFIAVGVIVYLVKTRGWDFLNQATDARDKDLRSKLVKEAALKEIIKARKKLAPGSEKSSEFLQSLGKSDPELLVTSVKKWLSEEGDGKLEK
ncbi:hypothetical protein MNBD_NITROSPINAE04-1639 [hydrothermal vent metagenome]|uniref:Uncharacterized protein n=1 Tax=hydrothermal vent metagenome TaxID=652676 RepID=A0A3B1CXU7_9ZZZZ